MNAPTPHYTLLAEADRPKGSGCWRFRLQTENGTEALEAADVEPGVSGERLQLLTVIRGLESLDQPSRVTLVGCSDYVRRGLEYGLAEWRENDWRWERFGQLVSIRNDDLWRRLDSALNIHEVNCGQKKWRYDDPHNGPSEPHNDRCVETDRDETRGGETGTSRPERQIVSLLTSKLPLRKIARRYVCELKSLCKTLGSWLKADTKTRSSFLVHTK